MHRTLRHLLAATASLAALTSAQAAPLGTDGQWSTFTVDETSAFFTNPGGLLSWLDGSGSAVSFDFTLATPGVLRVVDLFNPGDTFMVMLNGLDVQATGAVPQASFDPLSFEADPQTAFSSPAFSRLELALAPGSYSVSGRLLQSVLDGGVALNATEGAISVTAVPEPASVATLLTGLLLISSVLRSRRK